MKRRWMTITECKHAGGECSLKTPCKDCATYPVVLEQKIWWLNKRIEELEGVLGKIYDENFECFTTACGSCDCGGCRYCYAVEICDRIKALKQGEEG